MHLHETVMQKEFSMKENYEAAAVVSLKLPLY